jgi:hypothetical protein
MAPTTRSKQATPTPEASGVATGVSPQPVSIAPGETRLRPREGSRTRQLEEVYDAK